MRGLSLPALAAAVSAMLLLVMPARADGMIRAADWDAYKARFVDPTGRVIDDGNTGISHSEGQGYGLLLALLADAQADFDQIWSFTRTELLLRDDGLAAWKWDPAASPHVTDLNNATDGDILIAYALARAGTAWKRSDLSAAATSIADAVGKLAVTEQQGRMILMPAVAGFAAGDRADGPVVNLSYLVFEAFPEFERIAPATDWKRLGEDGRSLIGRGRFSPRKLPADWMSMKSRLRPAEGFPAEFGYNAVRIPLYLIRSGDKDRPLLSELRDGMLADDGVVHTFDLDTGDAKTALPEPGYRAIPALVSCVLDGTKLPADVAAFAPTLYYPSTLHLLVLSFTTEKHPECL